MRLPLRSITGLLGLAAMLAAAALALAPAAAQLPDNLELILSLADDSDNIVPDGSETEFQAELRFPEQPSPPGFYWVDEAPDALGVPAASVAHSSLRITGQAVWKNDGRLRYDIPAHTPYEATIRRLAVPGGANKMQVKAFDKRTLVARDFDTSLLNARLYIFDSYTLEYKATISTPAGAYNHADHGFGASASYNSGGTGSTLGKAIDLWHETDDRAWLFVGSYTETVESHGRVGQVYRFRLDWDGDDVTVTPQGTLEPTLAEADNRHGGDAFAHYGGALAFSNDGSTLAVSAARMNMMGAVYVYSRPDDPDKDWGDVTYADGVKVTAGAVPSFGTGTTDMPFLPGTAYDANTPRSCDAWCSMVWSSVATDSLDGVHLGVHQVALSADGSVLVVGAPQKEYAVNTPGGGFIAANRRDNAGEAFVFVAPEGGWQNAPLANLQADGSAKALIAAKTDATNFRRATHYSPGPLRRVTEPAAVLVAAAWPNPGGAYFAINTSISQDGSTITATPFSGDRVHVFQRDSADDWATLNGGYLTPSATLSVASGDNPRNGLAYFSADGGELAIGVPGHASGHGAVRVFSRPAGGTWVSAAVSTARRLWELDIPGNNVSGAFGNVIPDLSGTRVVFGTQSRNREYLVSLGGCATSTIDGAGTTTCPLNLPDSEVAVPTGTSDGEQISIAASIAVSRGAALRTLTGALELTVGTVVELTEAELDFAVDESTGRSYPSVVGPGESTTLLLRLLNERGKASATGSIASLLATTSQGALSARLGDAEDEACAADGGTACQFANPTTALTGGNTDKIRLTVTHPGAGKSGEATVRVNVTGSDGSAIATEPLLITFSGPPSALAIAEPPTAVLGYAPTDSEDPRNKTTLVVSASDASGNRATVPDTFYSAKLTDADGKTITAGRAELTWPLRNAAGELVLRDGNPQARVTISAAAESPLATGEYTLELNAGSGANKLTATQTVVVAGGASEMSLSADPAGDIAEGATVTVTATVTDASGRPVPDGTPVSFTEQPSGSNTVLVLASSSRQLTRDGRASVQLRAVGRGSAYVRAQADAAGDIQAIRVAAPAPPPLSELAAGLTANSFQTWTSAQLVNASALLAAIEGATRISVWDGAEWVSYGVQGGLLLPGSIDFLLTPGDVFWLDGG